MLHPRRVKVGNAPRAYEDIAAQEMSYTVRHEKQRRHNQKIAEHCRTYGACAHEKRGRLRTEDEERSEKQPSHCRYAPFPGTQTRGVCRQRVPGGTKHAPLRLAVDMQGHLLPDRTQNRQRNRPECQGVAWDGIIARDAQAGTWRQLQRLRQHNALPRIVTQRAAVERCTVKRFPLCYHFDEKTARHPIPVGAEDQSDIV